MTESDERNEWLKRADAMGRAQSRYLWIMLITGLFFFALKTSATQDQTISIPLIQLKLNSESVLAAGGTILSFLLVAAMGSLKAWRVALEEYAGAAWEKVADRLDLHPTAFDLAYFTVRDEAPILERLLYVTYYPGYFATIVAEATWLQWWLWTSSAEVRSLFLVLGTPTLAWAIWLTGRMWLGRIRRIFLQLRSS